MKTRGKSVTFCLIQSHVSIAGNEKADKRAKQETMTGNEYYPMYPCKDYYPLIKKGSHNRWQQQWTNTVNNKLRVIKDTVIPWPSSRNKNRKMEVILTRVRIGHRHTHGHLMEGRSASYCGSCIVPLTVRHIIIECSDYNLRKIRHFGGCTKLLKC